MTIKVIEKRCCHCHKVKTIDEFGRNKSKKDGHQEYCLLCAKYYRSLWRRYPNPDLESRRLHLSSPQNRYHQIKYRAAKDKISFLLHRDQFVSWFNGSKQICYYCGMPLELSGNGNLAGVTIDRKDNLTGYNLENIALSCRRCNTMKGSWLTEGQMLEIAKKYFSPHLSQVRKEVM